MAKTTSKVKQAHISADCPILKQSTVCATDQTHICKRCRWLVLESILDFSTMLSAATTIHTTATGSTTTTVANAIATTAVRKTEGDGDADTGRVERGSAGKAAEANEVAKQGTGTARVHVHALGSTRLSPERPLTRAFDS